MIDLQSHSTVSDGQLEPGDVVRSAAEAGIAVMALTDHDGVAGVEEANRVAAELGIENVPAVEMSCVHKYSEDLHICGYWVDLERIQPACDKAQQERVDRAKAIIAKLNEHGVDVSFEAAVEKAGAAERSMKSLEAELELARTEARQAKAEAERAKAAPAAEAPPGDDATVVAKVPGELRDMAQQVYESINDILSELRNNILLVQGELGNAGGGNEESLRIITDAVDSVVGNAEDAKGALRGLRELAES